VTLDDAAEWSLAYGRIGHESGGFFSVVGLRFPSAGTDNGWREQPFILQPEVGILGFLLDQNAHQKRLLVQAKTEPGKPGVMQLAPTFQCTRSNYLCRHGGTRAPYFEFFEDPVSGRVLADSDQSEQGTRFFDKYNRNVVVAVEKDEIELGADASAWRWMTVRDISRLITEDFLFNTDARSVLATCRWELLSDSGLPFEQWAKVPGFGQELQRSYQDAPTAAESRIAAPTGPGIREADSPTGPGACDSLVLGVGSLVAGDGLSTLPVVHADPGNDARGDDRPPERSAGLGVGKPASCLRSRGFAVHLL